MKEIKRNILLNPGPATTTDSVKYAQVIPDICPREKEFGRIMESISKDLVKIVHGNNEYICILFGGSGTAAIDAVLNSVVPPGKKILVINNGAYGKRQVEIVQAYGLDYVELKFDWEELPDLNQVEEQLKKDNKIACVSMVHHETTTGLLNPVRETGTLAHQYGKVFIVDTISSFAGMHLDINEFNIDFLMSTSNKCIQGMAGVCFIICKHSELDRIKGYPRRSYYLSLYDQYAYFKDHYQMRFTPPVQTIYALRQAIDEFLAEGAENRYARYTKNWQTLRKGVAELGFKILTEAENESHILITLLYPEDKNFNFDLLHDKCYTEGFTIYPGKVGKINSFRLANMGAIDHQDIQRFLKVLARVLDEMKVKLK